MNERAGFLSEKRRLSLVKGLVDGDGDGDGGGGGNVGVCIGVGVGIRPGNVCVRVGVGTGLGICAGTGRNGVGGRLYIFLPSVGSILLLCTVNETVRLTGSTDCICLVYGLYAGTAGVLTE